MSVVLVLVMALVMVIAVVLVEVGSATVHRARARTGADAVALAGAVDGSAGDELGGWYARSGVAVVGGEGFAHAVSGPSQASSWATTAPGDVVAAPAVVAIVARAAQLLGVDFSAVRMRGTTATFTGEAAHAIATIAAELGLCPVLGGPDGSDAVSFELCG